jgi:uncharacterized protein YutE (UPF0331/DUF86 family)
MGKLINNPESSIQVQSSTESAPFSRTTVAKINVAEQALVDIKASMIQDLSQKRMDDPNQFFSDMQKLQSVQDQLNNFKQVISSKASQAFTKNDVTSMQTMREEGATDAEVAQVYETSPATANRLINGVKIPSA